MNSEEKEFPKGKGKEKKGKDGKPLYNPRGKGNGRRKDQCPPEKQYPQNPFWYAQNVQAIADMAGLPWNEVVGSLIPSTAQDIVPGAMVAEYYPAFTTDTSEGNFATRSADAYFQYVTQGFTSSVDFEAPDLMMTALAGETLFAYLCEMKRCYGIMHYYLQNNAYYAEHIVRALGFDFDDWKANLANFRSRFNILADQVSKIVAVPKDFKIGDRWEFLSSYLFTDTSAPEYSTVYAYRLGAALQFDGTSYTTGTALAYFPVHGNTDTTVSQAFAYADALLNALTNDDCRKIFGAIRRVYSDDSLKKVSLIDENLTTTVVNHDIMSLQLHNATFFSDIGAFSSSSTTPGTGIIYSASSGDNVVCPIYQDANGNIHCNIFGSQATAIGGTLGPTAAAAVLRNGGNVIIDLYDHDATPGVVLDATANIAVVNSTGGQVGAGSNGPIFLPIQVRTEALRGIFVRVMGNSLGNSVEYQVPQYALSALADSTQWTTYIPELLRNIGWLTKLDSHPLIPVGTKGTSVTVSVAGGSTTATFAAMQIDRLIGEIDKYSEIASTAMNRMNSRALYTLLMMPQSTKSVSH